MGALRQRDPRQRESAYLGWVAQCPCVACFVEHSRLNWEVQVAHVRFADADAGWRSVGMAEKPDDRRTAPLCAGHHTDGPGAQHDGNEREFWERLGIDVTRLCADLSDAFDRGVLGAAVIADHAGRARKSVACRQAAEAWRDE